VVADLLADVIAGVVDFYFFILLPVKVDVSQIRSRWGFVFGLLGRVLGLSCRRLCLGRLRACFIDFRLSRILLKSV
jgi:hypothetical protein